MLQRRTALAALATVLLATPVHAVDQALVDAARREGTVVWYSGLIVNQAVRPLSEAFEKRYPGIRVQGSRLTSSELALKAINEARAGRPQADLFDGTSLVFRLQAAGIVEPYRAEAARAFPEGSVDPAGYWTSLNTYILTPAINTELVQDPPRTLDDLLDPKWRGKLAWTNDLTTAGPPGFIANILLSRGKDEGLAYLKRLATQRIVNVPAAQRVVLDQVIGGQYPAALMTFNYHSVISAAEGAPVRWLPLEPALQMPNAVGLIKNAPHPNAGRLFLEFLLGPEGQAVIRDANYLPSNPAIAPRDPKLLPGTGGFKVTVITPEMMAAHLEEWVAVYNELFK